VQAIPVTVLLLALSNVFMTFAWYAHLKIPQEVLTPAVFAPFIVLHMRQPLELDCLSAALCILGAVYFVFIR
jgi:uncharacterized protein (DUF486 family)